MAKWILHFQLTPEHLASMRWAEYPLMKPYPWASHNLGITQRTTPKTIVTNDTPLPITVGVFNYGNYAESFTLSIRANSTILASFVNVALQSRNSSIFIFSWNTTEWTKGNYTITAQITIVLGETDIADNTRTLNVTITIAGDYNGDGTVNISDAYLVQQAWQSTQGQPDYNPNADFNNDGIIDIADASIIGGNWQKHV